MIPEKLNAERVQHWLSKTSHRISTMGGSSDMESNSKKAELCTRYNELKDRAIELGVWETYCDAPGRGWAHSHDGFDCAA